MSQNHFVNNMNYLRSATGKDPEIFRRTSLSLGNYSEEGICIAVEIIANYARQARSRGYDGPQTRQFIEPLFQAFGKTEVLRGAWRCRGEQLQRYLTDMATLVKNGTSPDDARDVAQRLLTSSFW